MKPEKFMQAMGEINPEIIEELANEENQASAAKAKVVRFNPKKLVGLAACFVCIIALAIMIPIIKPQTNGLFSNNGDSDAADLVIDNESQTNNSLSHDGKQDVV